MANQVRLTPHSPVDPIVEARRCTVQFGNGRLYLDAAASPATSLLGHDEPILGSSDRERLIHRLSSFDPEFRCVVLARNIDAALAIGRHALQYWAGPPSGIEVMDGASPEGAIPDTRERVLAVREELSLARSGRWFACSGWDRKPDFVLVGDSLTAGEPFGALLVSRRWPKPPPHGGEVPSEATVARAAGVIDTIETMRLIEHGHSLAEYLRARLEAVQRATRQIGSIEMIGLRATLTLPARISGRWLKRRLCERGVLVKLDAADRVVIEPPLVLRPAEVDVITGALRAALLSGLDGPAGECCSNCAGISS